MDGFVYTPYTVYTNIPKLLDYRKLILVSESDIKPSESPRKKASKQTKTGSDGGDSEDRVNAVKMDRDKFVNEINYYGNITITAHDAPGKDRRFSKQISKENRSKPVVTYIVLFNENSQHTASSTTLAKFLNKIPNITETNRKENIEIILLSRDLLGIHLVKKINSYITDGDSTGGYIHIENYEYMCFTSERPKHKLVAAQRILSREEEELALKMCFKTKKDIPMIRKRDVIAIWLGAETGDLIEIEQPSLNCGIEIKYAVVR